MTHICASELTIIGSDNGLSPGRRQAIIWTNAGILLFRPLGTNFIEILIEIHIFSFKKMHFKCLSAKWRPFCLGLNVLIICQWHRVIFKRTTGLHAVIDHSNGFPRWQLYSRNRKCFRVSHMDNWPYIGNTFGKSTYRSLGSGVRSSQTEM